MIALGARKCKYRGFERLIQKICCIFAQLMDRVGSSELMKHYGGRLRLRVMGISMSEDRLLLIKHKGFGAEGYLWAPPGGGVEFGESITDALKREFLEETGLEVEVEQFLFVNEYIALPLHAVELFFSVKRIGGELKLGSEERNSGQRVIEELRYFTIKALRLLPSSHLHVTFHNLSSFSSLFKKRSCA